MSRAIRWIVITVLIGIMTGQLALPIATAAPQGEVQRIGNGTARAAAWSLDGKTLAVGGSLGVWLYTPELKPVAHLEGNEGEITALVWNPNGKQIATASGSQRVQVWDVATGKAQTLDTRAPFATEQRGSVSFSPDGSRLASAAFEKGVNIWETATGRLITTLQTGGAIFSVAWSPVDARLAVGGALQMPPQQYEEGLTDGMLLQIWDGNSGKPVKKYDNPSVNHVVTVQWRVNFKGGRGIAAATAEYYVSNNILLDRIFAIDLDNNKEDYIESVTACASQLVGIQFAPDSKNYSYVVMNCSAGTWPNATVGLRQVGSGYSLGRGQAYGGDTIVRAMAWHPDGNQIVIVQGDGRITLYRAKEPGGELQIGPPPELLATLDAFHDVPTQIAWDGQKVIGTAYTRVPDTVDYKSITWYEMSAGKVMQTFERKDQLLLLPSVSPDRKFVAYLNPRDLKGNNTSVDKSLQIADVQSGQVVKRLDTQIAGDDWQLYKLVPQWSPDGKYISVYEPQRTGPANFMLWDVETGKLLINAQDPKGKCIGMIWSSDSQYLVGTSNGTPCVIRPASNETVATLPLPNKVKLQNAVWGPNARSVALLGSDGNIHLYQVPSANLLITLPGQRIEWSADKWRLMVVNGSKNLRIYNANTAEVITEFSSETDTIQVTAFSPDGTKLAGAGRDGIVRVWDTSTGKTLSEMLGHRGAVMDLMWRPDGKQLLSRSKDNTIRIWNIEK